MMKKISVFFLLFLFVIPLVLGITTNIKKEYSPLETMILKIDGNFIDGIKKENVFFYSDRVFIPLKYDVNKIGDSYYLYAILPNKIGNYSLVLKNIHYFEEGKEKIENLEFNFSISGNVSLFSVEPGFIITDKDFSIKVISNNKEINVKSSFGNSFQNTSINAGSSKNILFSIKNINSTSITKVILESEKIKYEIPIAVFIYSKNNETINEGESNILIFYPSNDTIYLEKNTEITKKLYLFNNGTQDIKDLKIIIPDNLTDIIQITPNKIEIIEAKNYSELVMIINSKTNDASGIINVRNNYYSIQFPLSIKISTNYTLINQSKEELRYCYELSGKVCDSGERCTTQPVKTIESPNLAICCLGGCEKLKSEESKSKTFVIILIIILLLVIFYFIYKKLKIKGKSPEKVIKERAEDYEEKFKKVRSEEVRGNLKKY